MLLAFKINPRLSGSVDLSWLKLTALTAMSKKKIVCLNMMRLLKNIWIMALAHDACERQGAAYGGKKPQITPARILLK